MLIETSPGFKTLLVSKDYSTDLSFGLFTSVLSVASFFGAEGPCFSSTSPSSSQSPPS